MHTYQWRVHKPLGKTKITKRQLRNYKLQNKLEEETHMTDITTIEGIGPAYAEKLAKADVTSCEGLLEKGASSAGRKDIAEASGIGDSLILKWVNAADLCRIKGVGGEFAELLEASGVDSVPELAQRNAENLAAKMAEVNDTKKLCKAAPSAKTVSKWIEEAKGMEPMVTH